MANVCISIFRLIDCAEGAPNLVHTGYDTITKGVFWLNNGKTGGRYFEWMFNHCDYFSKIRDFKIAIDHTHSLLQHQH